MADDSTVIPGGIAIVTDILVHYTFMLNFAQVLGKKIHCISLDNFQAVTQRVVKFALWNWPLFLADFRYATLN